MKISRIAPYLAPLAAGALVAVAAVVHVSWWQDRYVAPFDHTVESAREAADASAQAFAALGAARGETASVVDRASALADASAGYLGAAELAALQDLITDAREHLADEVPSIPAAPSFARPELVAIETATELIRTWTESDEALNHQVEEMADAVTEDASALEDSSLALARSVIGAASGELGAAPLATVDTRTAVERARDALASAAEGDDLAALVGAYVSTIGQLRASQQAEAAAQQSSGSSSSFDLFSPDLLAQMHDAFCRSLPFPTDDCPARPW